MKKPQNALFFSIIYIPVESSLANTRHFRNLFDTIRFALIQFHGAFEIPLVDTWTSAFPPPGTGTLETFLCPFHDQIALELAEGLEDRHHEPPLRGGRIEVLLQADQLHVLLLEVGDQINQILGAPSQAGEALHHHHVPRAQLILQPVQLRTVALRPRHLFRQDFVAFLLRQQVQLPV